MNSLREILILVLNIAWFFVIAHLIMSWLINFQVLNIRQPLVRQVWDALQRILEPLYRRVRRFIPIIGGIDFAPLAVLVAVIALQIIVSNNLR